MKSEYNNIDRIAMLFELGLNYHKELKNALAADDEDKAFYFSEMYICVKKIINDIEKEDEQ